MALNIIISFLFYFFCSEANSQKNLESLSIFDKDQVLSVFSVNYFYNKKPLSRDSKIKCELNFYDDYKKKVISKVDENSNYVILLSNPGKVYLDNIKCSRHSIPMIYGASRFKIIDDMGFVANAGFVSYIGEVNINYSPSFFKILDIFNLSNFLNDKSGALEIKVNDNVFDVLNFINLRFSDVYHLKLTKSILGDSHALNPNATPEIYSPNNSNKNEIIEPIINKIEKNEKQKKIDNEDEISIEDKKIESVVDSIKRDDLIKKLDENNSNRNNNLQNYQHPYLATRYSDFYSPVYDPYQLIGIPPSFYLMHSFAIQDPVIEHPH